MNWQIGDRCIINCPKSNEHGAETEILALNVSGISLGYKYVGHRVDIHCPTSPTYYCIFEPHELIPIPDEYDGLSVTTWDECVWKPSVTV